jgi:alkanesulfonate monooxygenase SsuD/methylene tetrahydromethanopterin reductase-like flavin-dependent oxidoreductase (luciferase family)
VASLSVVEDLDEQFLRRANEEARVMMEMHLTVGETDAAISNAVMLAFTRVNHDRAKAPQVVGSISRLLPNWLDEGFSADEVFEDFVVEADIDQELIDQIVGEPDLVVSDAEPSPG